MCGIIGYSGVRESASILIEGLKRLEYRGYDSAGLSIWENNIEQYKSAGNIEALKNSLPSDLSVDCGIAHTRWATHGSPTEINAHPHLSHSNILSIVHNGIIENYLELKSELAAEGYEFKSETDTEVLVNLVEREYKKIGFIPTAITSALSLVKGSYAFALISKDAPGKIYAVRNGSPLVVGLKENGCFVASDIVAFGESVKKVMFLEDGDMVILEPEGQVELFDFEGNEKPRKYESLSHSFTNNGKMGFEDYMLKEIFEQPETVKSTFYLSDNIFNELEVKVGDLLSRETKPSRIIVVACGTSWHAGLVGKNLIEKISRIPVSVEYASEFRYRSPVIEIDDLVIFISQSGETADTLAANRMVREKGARTLGICNVETSTLVRETDAQLFLKAGMEIGVASTKAFTSQVLVLSQFAFFLGKLYNGSNNYNEFLTEFKSLPLKIEKILTQSKKIKNLAIRYSMANNFLFVGRGMNYPVALEGALKLKEISYIHAEGYPGAEMKHGPIALIDYSLPTIAILTDKENRHKMITGIKEIQSRNGRVIAIIADDDTEFLNVADDTIVIPSVCDDLAPVLSIIPLQLFSYYMAKVRGCNVDQPRNLAKSVTVE
jgi:glucosamine--fructose-6-phosphate aminotransferase (isomerizing)